MTDIEEIVGPGMLPTNIPASVLRTWERRALTIQLKAADLLSAIMDRAGPESPLSDGADNILSYAQDLGDMLVRSIVLRKPAHLTKEQDNPVNETPFSEHDTSNVSGERT